jgi:hypothetical protein
MDHCLVTTHIKCKPSGYQVTKYKSSTSGSTPLPAVLPGVVDSLTTAINAGNEVYIAYANRDPNEQRARKIKPFQWIRYGECFKAFCFIDNMNKTFNAHKFLRIEEQSWVISPPEGIYHHMLQHDCMLIFATGKSTVTLPKEPRSSVEDWLCGIGLSRYWPTFEDNGYDVMVTLDGLDERTLDLLGVQLPGHHSLFLGRQKR